MLLLRLPRVHLSSSGCQPRLVPLLYGVQNRVTWTINGLSSLFTLNGACLQCSARTIHKPCQHGACLQCSARTIHKPCQQSRHFSYEEVTDEMIKKSKWKKQLGKFNLTFFVAGTSLAGYAAAPLDPNAVSYLAAYLSIGAPSTLASSLAIFSTFTGTFLCSMSANTFNHMFESAYDAQGKKHNRPFPSGIVSSQQGLGFGLHTCVLGTGILALGANLATALLGFANILLYAYFYTSSKRTTLWNTWIGAVVGAIPPMMGWVAATGVEGVLLWQAWILPLFVFSWQFPHFNAISWLSRRDYGRAGYPMMSVIDPDKARVVARRHALCQLLLTPIICYNFAPSYLMLAIMAYFNGHLLHCAWKFHKFPTEYALKLMFSSFRNIFVVVTLVILSSLINHVNEQSVLAHNI